MIPEIIKEPPIINIGKRQDLEPTASPFVTTKASPSVANSAIVFVGLKSALV